ncbi:Pentatricopeptide repeat-containing protein [Symbiodinium microadriaticum]|uniref:Pentatricopeptide repeat-containing protein n=1 Tax=Symbiodinium microadriaticum TaxID=2951 RepID=A0A1Q9EAC2_SYMMI|nr:Pentatricopeptide repeat-containing protein [Symbiodinium microadriaticum]
MVVAQFRKLGGGFGHNAALTRALVKAGALAPKLLEQAVARRVEPNVRHLGASMAATCRAALWYGIAANACRKGASWHGALQVMEDMEAAYLPRDLVTMNTSLRAMVGAAKWRQALMLLKQMVNSTKVDVVSFTEGIAACGAVARWQQAMSLLLLADEQMVAHDSHSYNSAIAACDGASCWTIALLLADDMRRRQIQQNLVSMNSSISAASNAAAWPVVAALFEKLPHMLLRPDDITYGSVINAFQKAARWQMALHFMALWQGRGLFFLTLGTLFRQVSTYQFPSKVGHAKRYEDRCAHVEDHQAWVRPDLTERGDRSHQNPFEGACDAWQGRDGPGDAYEMNLMTSSRYSYATARSDQLQYR